MKFIATSFLLFLAVIIVESKVVQNNQRKDYTSSYDDENDEDENDIIFQKIKKETEIELKKIKAETRMQLDAIEEEAKIQLKSIKKQEEEEEEMDFEYEPYDVKEEENKKEFKDEDEEEGSIYFVSTDDEEESSSTEDDNQNDKKDISNSKSPHKKEFLSRIIGGNIARIGEFPFLVNYGGGCGGSLIASNLVLTAAHCEGIQSDEVRVGSVYASRGGEQARIIKKIPHPLYDNYTFDYDYMILVLDHNIDTGIYPPIELNTNSKNPRDGDMLTVAGFGVRQEGSEVGSYNLMKVDVPVVSQSTCLSQYSEEYGSYAIKEEIHLCAGYANGGKDSCQGDSGGPIFKEINGIITQVGVVSWGVGCAQADYSGVYARITGVLPWLKSEICEKDNGNNIDDISLCKANDDDAPNSSILLTSAIVAIIVISVVVVAVFLRRRKIESFKSESRSVVQI